MAIHLLQSFESFFEPLCAQLSEPGANCLSHILIRLLRCSLGWVKQTEITRSQVGWRLKFFDKFCVTRDRVLSWSRTTLSLNKPDSFRFHDYRFFRVLSWNNLLPSKRIFFRHVSNTSILCVRLYSSERINIIYLCLCIFMKNKHIILFV